MITRTARMVSDAATLASTSVSAGDGGLLE